ncbi:MAG: bifunctional nuclease domain-containing protein [Calditrichota bacterium]
MKRLPVEVTGISICAPYQGYVVILKEREGLRWLPIFIGAPEAHNISLLLQGLKYVRPLTYDLFNNLLEAAGARVEAVSITDLRDNTFFAEVQILLANDRIRAIDARPSDAIALAIKTRAPIFVSSKVMDEAGLTGEEVPPSPPDIHTQIQELNNRLNEAVEQEAYENAARIRDQIRSLEEKVRVS